MHSAFKVKLMAIPAYKLDPCYSPNGNSNVSWTSATSSVVMPLTKADEADVLSVLSTPSLTNVIMSGFIRDNGVASPMNRGRFYACRNERNELTGVALIGHTTLFAAFDDDAVQAFASLARENSSNHLLMGEHNAVRQFWTNYAVDGESPRLVHPVLFLQRSAPFKEDRLFEGLRLATRKDLEEIVLAQAAMAFETSGVDPLAKDPAGFCERYVRRINKNRVWVLMKDGRLIFKVDVTSESPDVAYLEGVYVSPEERGKGLGRSCLQAIGNILLERKKAIYLFVEQENTRLQSFYFDLGFSVGGNYDLLYF